MDCHLGVSPVNFPDFQTTAKKENKSTDIKTVIFSLIHHACIMNTPYNSLLYSKSGVHMGIHHFLIFALNQIAGTR